MRDPFSDPFLQNYATAYKRRADAKENALKESPSPADVARDPEIYKKWWEKHQEVLLSVLPKTY